MPVQKVFLGLQPKPQEGEGVSLVVHQKYAGFFMVLEDSNGSNRELFLEALYQSFLAQANTAELLVVISSYLQ